jgi:hypothetical protein
MQVLGPVEATCAKRWIAHASLEIQGVAMGADAVVNTREEKVPGFNCTLRCVRGTAVRTIDQAGLIAVWTRWFGVELAKINRWTIALALMMVGMFWFGVARELFGATSSGREFTSLLTKGPFVFLVTMLFATGVGCSCLIPVVITTVARMLKWPQLAAAVIVSFVVGVTIDLQVFVFGFSQNPLGSLPAAIAVVGAKVFLAKRVDDDYRKLRSVFPLREQGNSEFRQLVGMLLTLATVLIGAAIMIALVYCLHNSE